MDFLKSQNVRWKRPEKRNKPNVVATTAKHPDSRSQILRYGWMQPTCIRSVTFWGKWLPAAVSAPAVAICLNSLMCTSSAGTSIQVFFSRREFSSRECYQDSASRPGSRRRGFIFFLLAGSRRVQISRWILAEIRGGNFALEGSRQENVEIPEEFLARSRQVPGILVGSQYLFYKGTTDRRTDN